jgi:hypothetical protein
MSANYYFINNAGATEKAVSFESWIVWHKLSGTTDLPTTATGAKKEYIAQITTAIEKKWGNLAILATAKQQAVNAQAVSFVLFY